MQVLSSLHQFLNLPAVRKPNLFGLLLPYRTDSVSVELHIKVATLGSDTALLVRMKYF